MNEYDQREDSTAKLETINHGRSSLQAEFVRAHFYGNKQQKQWVPFPRMVLCMAGVGDAFANAVVILVRVKPLNRRNIWNESP